MPVYYLEPSALVKYYVTEPGSVWVRQLVEEAENVLVSAEITIAEVSAALAIIARVGRISRRQHNLFWERCQRDFLRRYELLPIRRTTINRAAGLCIQHPLRGFDAIHLASGLQLQDTLAQQGDNGHTLASTYITSDDRLVAAARAEGLSVDNPFWYIDLDTLIPP